VQPNGEHWALRGASSGCSGEAMIGNDGLIAMKVGHSGFLG
jgi:hypothetical protein